MKSVLSLLGTVALLGALALYFPQVKEGATHLVPSTRSIAQANPMPSVSRQMKQVAEPSEELNVAATPEDPGKMMVAGPLAVWMKEQDERDAAQQDAAAAYQPQKIDHVFAAETPDALQLVKGSFGVARPKQFVFDVPPHTIHARLKGDFRSKPASAPSRFNCDRTGEVEVLLINKEQFQAMASGHPSGAVYDEISCSQSVDLKIPSTFDSTERYHLIFSTPPESRVTQTVRADLAVSFE